MLDLSRTPRMLICATHRRAYVIQEAMHTVCTSFGNSLSYLFYMYKDSSFNWIGTLWHGLIVIYHWSRQASRCVLISFSETFFKHTGHLTSWNKLAT